MRRIGIVLLLMAALGCGSEDIAATPPSGHVPQGWAPGVSLPGPREVGPRGWIDRRGLIHAHSVHSHDACDGEPRDEETDAINQPCFDDFRRDLCKSRHDFVMLSDHRDSFTRTEYPDVLLYREELGDQLVERGGKPVASWAGCDGQDPALIMGGAEAGTMPVGLEGHVSAVQSERSDIYGRDDAEAIELLKGGGAVALVQHTETWTPKQLIDLPFDGFEMYNLHQNLQRNFGPALGVLNKIDATPELLPHSDLVLLPILQEEPDYLATWATVLESGARRVTTAGTDCHRNTFPAKLPDGERIDSYRRMMVWFSNHLLIKPKADGSWDDADLKDALRARRLFAVFEVFGFAQGFDFHASESGSVREMGETAALSEGVELNVSKPGIIDLDPTVEAPDIELRILVARDGAWELVDKGSDDLAFTVTEAGAYRAEVRITPRHLAPYLSSYVDQAERQFVWIYSNAIWVE